MRYGYTRAFHYVVRSFHRLIGYYSWLVEERIERSWRAVTIRGLDS